MASSEGRSGLAIVVAAALLAIGFAVGGYFAAKAGMRFKVEARTVTVKGLVEKDVGSDLALWTLGFRRTGDSLPELQRQLAGDREAVLAFLRARGFDASEIEVLPTRTADRFAQEFGGNNPSVRFRYVLVSSVAVQTAKVDRVRMAAGETDELLQKGVPLNIVAAERANPRYVLTNFNQLRPELLAQATRNARETAQRFAAEAGASVGAIQSANQGTIQIFGSDGNDESGAWAPTSTPVKRIRVVSTFEFALR